MTFDVSPDLVTLIRRAETDLTGRVAGERVLAGQFERRLARVVAGAAHGLHGHIDWAARQVFPSTADAVGVLRWADLLGLAREQPVKATGVIGVTGDSGATVPEGTVWSRRDGVEYRSTTEATLVDGEAAVDVEAVVASAAGNTPDGTRVSLTGNVSGLWPDGEFLAPGARRGRDIESIEALKWRVERRFRRPGRGGGAGDYEEWALEVPGVSRAQEKPLWLGPGTVGVFIYGPDVDSEVVDTAQAHLNRVAPLTARVTVLAPEKLPIMLEATLEPADQSTRERVERTLQAVFERLAPGGILRVSQIHGALVDSGLDWYELRAPSADIVPEPHQRLIFGGWV